MFNIKELVLYQNERELVRYDYNKSINYYYADNSYGKTVMISLLDYMLGKTDFEGRTDGLEGITDAELICTSDCFKRNLINKECKHKYITDNDYRNVSLDIYKQLITQKLVTSKQVLESLSALTGKEITHRTMTIFNFIEQTKLGDLDLVFTKLDKLEYQLNTKEIFKYIFNRENYVELLKNKTRIEELENQLKSISINEDKYNFYRQEIDNLFNILGIKQDKNDYKNLEKIQAIKDSLPFNEKKTANKEHLFLLQAINSLNNQIKMQRELKNQCSMTTDEINRQSILLKELNKICDDDPQLSDIVNSIKQKVVENKNINAILSMKDYNKTIAKLEKEKKDFESRLSIINYNYNKNDYIDRSKNIQLLIDYLNKILSLTPSNKAAIESKLKDLRDKNKQLLEMSNKNINQFINRRINFYYKSLLNNIEFIKKDYERNNFELKFDCNKIIVRGTEEESIQIKNEIKQIRVDYLPGSHARQTLIQICCYFAMLELLISNNASLNLPTIPLLIMDCANQPLSPENKKCIVDLAKLFVKENKNQIKVILTSDYDIDLSLDSEINYVRMVNGFNPLINPKVKH